MSVCKVLLFGLKPCDISSCTNNKLIESSSQQLCAQNSTATQIQLDNIKVNSSTSDTDGLNIVIKPLVTPSSSVREIRVNHHIYSLNS